MKITRRQLRKIIKESMEEFGQKFDAAYKQPDGSHKGHPDEKIADIPQEMLDRINSISRGDLQDALWDIVDAVDAGVGHYNLDVLERNITAAERMDSHPTSRPAPW